MKQVHYDFLQALVAHPEGIFHKSWAEVAGYSRQYIPLIRGDFISLGWAANLTGFCYPTERGKIVFAIAQARRNRGRRSGVGFIRPRYEDWSYPL